MTEPRAGDDPRRGAPQAPAPTPPPGLVAALLPGELAEFALLAWPTRPAEQAAGLSEAEREVVRLVAAGLSNAEIARRRGTSRRTVANQLASVFRKTGVHSRFELLAGSR